MDIGGLHWDTKAFLRSDRSVLEGLAQFYTLEYLSRAQDKEPGPLEAYQRLLLIQPPDYHTHLLWLEGGATAQSEAVRLALLDGRLESACRASNFAADVAETKVRLGRAANQD